MAERAQVTSVEAVESFRADLIVFLTKARSVLEEACDEVLRTRQWVQNDQRRLWEHEMKVRARKLEEARAELFRARLSQFQDSTTLQQMAVHRADRAIREAEAKLAVLKKWDRELENRTDPLVKMLNQIARVPPHRHDAGRRLSGPGGENAGSVCRRGRAGRRIGLDGDGKQSGYFRARRRFSRRGR